MKNRKYVYAVFIIYLITFLFISTTKGRELNVTHKNLSVSSNQKKDTELVQSREIGKYKVVIKYKDFDKTKHKLKFHKKYKTSLMKVDNQEYYGTDGTIPFTEISSISFFEQGKEYTFPLTQYNLLFEPHVEDPDYFSIKEHTSHIEINLAGGDGAGGYEVKWFISKKGKTIKRQASDILVLNKRKKPEITFSRLKRIYKK